jgi:hypothetical protein
MRKTREAQRPSIEERNTLHEESGPVINNLMSRDVEVGARVKSVSVASAYIIEGKSLVVLQVNCRSIYNKALEFWNLDDSTTPILSQARSHGLRTVLTMLKYSGLILQLSEGLGLPMVGEFLSVSKISLPVNSCV